MGGFKQRIIHDGEMFKCYCSREDAYRDCNDFHKTKKDHGFQYTCKYCAKQLAMSKTDNSNENPKDLKIAHELLKNIGYNPESDESIHYQFIKKYNLL